MAVSYTHLDDQRHEDDEHRLEDGGELGGGALRLVVEGLGGGLEHPVEFAGLLPHPDGGGQLGVKAVHLGDGVGQGAAAAHLPHHPVELVADVAVAGGAAGVLQGGDDGQPAEMCIRDRRSTASTARCGGRWSTPSSSCA